jgi:hypothetical protein
VHVLALAGILVGVEYSVKDIDVGSAILPTDEILDKLEVQATDNYSSVLSNNLLGIRF